MDIPALKTFQDGEVVTASDLNSNIRDAFDFLMNPPAANLCLAADQSIATGVDVALNLTNVVQDNDGMYSALSPGGLTIVTPGVYRLSAGVLTNTLSAATTLQLYVLKNAATAAVVSIRPAAAKPGALQATTEVRCIAGDRITASVFHNHTSSTNALNVASTTFLSARWALA